MTSQEWIERYRRTMRRAGVRPELSMGIRDDRTDPAAGRTLCPRQARPGCSTRAFAAPDRRVIESQSVRLSANSLRPCRIGSVPTTSAQSDGQMIFDELPAVWEPGPDLGFRGAPLRNRTVDLLLTMDRQTVPVSAAEALSR